MNGWFKTCDSGLPIFFSFNLLNIILYTFFNRTSVDYSIKWFGQPNDDIEKLL